MARRINNSGEAKLTSSFLTRMKWKGSNLTVDIGNRSYDFIGVPNKIIKGLKRANSPGKFFNERLKGNYQKPMS